MLRRGLEVRECGEILRERSANTAELTIALQRRYQGIGGDSRLPPPLNAAVSPQSLGGGVVTIFLRGCHSKILCYISGQVLLNLVNRSVEQRKN